MIVESVYIEKFRCIKKTQLNCDELTVIIGRNGSGKSSFLMGKKGQVHYLHGRGMRLRLWKG